MTTYSKAILERFDAVVTGKAHQRGQMLTINIKNINGLFLERFAKQVRLTYGYVLERLQRLSYVDSFLISPGITKNGNVHYHVLLVMTNSFKVIRPVRSLFKGYASIHWSDPCSDAGDVKSCINYIVIENALPSAQKLKISLDDVIVFHQSFAPSPEVVDRELITKLSEVELEIVRGASLDDPTEWGMSEKEYKNL